MYRGNEMDKKVKQRIIVIAILVATVIGFHIYNMPENRLARVLDLGQKYLLEEDYEQAIVDFNKALEIDSKDVDAYLGIADAYVGMGNVEAAINILEQGYELTENEEIQWRLDEQRSSIAEIESAEMEENITEENDEQEEGELPYYELGFSPEDFTLAGYSVMDGDHLADILQELSKIMPNQNANEYNYTGWAWGGSAEEGMLYCHEDMCMPVAFSYFVGDKNMISIGITGAPVEERPLILSKVLPYKNSYEEVLDILGIREIIEQTKTKEKFVDEYGIEQDYSVFSFKSQYGDTECMWDKELKILSITTDNWMLSVSFYENVLDTVEMSTVEK